MMSLLPLSVLLGLAMLWVFRRMSNQQAIREAKRRLRAHLYELRLFVDEPKLVWQAQVALLRENARYLGLMLVPAAVLTVPLMLLFVQLDAFYGSSPLAPGRAAIVTVRLSEPLRVSDSAPSLELPEGITAETPPLRVPAEREVNWRVRPLHPVSGALRVTVGGESATKTIVAGAGPTYLSRRRANSAVEILRHPQESQLQTRKIVSIEVDYPAAEIRWLGVRLQWVWWLLIISIITAFLLRRRFRVAF